jgi:DNA-binding NarL/FixJ family response regulator
MDLQIDNIRGVLQRCVAGRDPGLGLALVCGAGWYWITRATSEGIRWIDELSGGELRRAPAIVRFIRGFLAILQADQAAAGPELVAAAEAAEREGNASLRGESLAMAAVAAHMAGDAAAAGSLLDAASALAAEIDDYLATIAVLQARSLAGLFDGDLAAIDAAATEGVRLGRAVGDSYALEMMLLNLGLAALLGGRLDEARQRFSESLRIARQIDDRVAQYLLLDALGCRAAGAGELTLAAQLLGAAETVQSGIGPTVFPHLAPQVVEAKETTGRALGAATFQAEFDAGTRLSRHAAIALALGEPVVAEVAGEASEGPSPLGERGTEVAQLVADGLTNKQIAARLFISEHTVDSHIRNIMNKLGLRSRAQIAAWMAAATPGTE